LGVITGLDTASRMFPACGIKQRNLAAKLLWIHLLCICREDRVDCRIKSGNDAVRMMRFDKPDSRGFVPADHALLDSISAKKERRGCP
jgi:hypothetical protein